MFDGLGTNFNFVILVYFNVITPLNGELIRQCSILESGLAVYLSVYLSVLLLYICLDIHTIKYKVTINIRP